MLKPSPQLLQVKLIHSCLTYLFSRFNNSMNTPVVIFTDLDGPLLDHHNYSFIPAIFFISFQSPKSLFTF